MAVLFYHVSELSKNKLGLEPWGGVFFAGDLGVDFFFVLSGFIILYTNAHSIGNPLAAKKYFYRRVTRIYPIFLTVCLFKLAFMLGTGGGGVREGKTGLSYLLTSFLLVPQDRAPFLDVAWTLSFEMTFYLMFLVLILYGPGFWRAVQAHAALVVLLNIPGMPLLEFPAKFFFSPFFLQFYLGCVVCHFVKGRSWSRRTGLIALVGGVGMFLIGYFSLRSLQPLGEMPVRTYLGAACALSVFGSVVLGAEFDRLIPRWLKFTGDASYSVYLMHGNIVNIGINWLASHGHDQGRVSHWTLLALAAVSLGGSCAYYLLVEKPLLTFCQKHTPK